MPKLACSCVRSAVSGLTHARAAEGFLVVRELLSIPRLPSTSQHTAAVELHSKRPDAAVGDLAAWRFPLLLLLPLLLPLLLLLLLL